jgi:hypothetical protein
MKDIEAYWFWMPAAKSGIGVRWFVDEEHGLSRCWVCFYLPFCKLLIQHDVVEDNYV